MLSLLWPYSKFLWAHADYSGAEKENETVLSPLKTSSGYTGHHPAEDKSDEVWKCKCALLRFHHSNVDAVVCLEFECLTVNEFVNSFVCFISTSLQTKWRGHLGALFSPVLKMFGTEDGGDEAAAQDERRAAEEAAAAAEAQRQQDEVDEDDEGEFNPYLFIKQLPPYHEARCGDVNLAPRLPPRRMTRNTTPVTLVLDLDETLVHCSVEGGSDSDLIFPVNFNGVTYQVGVKMRPYMDRFLRAVADKFEVVVFTASQQVYADTLLDIIDPQRELIKHRLFRDSCLLVEGNYLKDLNVLGRDLSKTVLVDNSPHAFGYQVDNGIPIESWFDDPNDTELLKLAEFLDTIQDVNDVRPLVRAHFKQFELVRDAR